MVKDEPGGNCKDLIPFAENNLSIEALIQHEDRNKSDDINKVPVVILSGPVNDASADKISKSLIDLDEVDQHLKQYRIHSDKKIMKYFSTRGLSPAASFSDVMLGGLAPDGGLYMPENNSP